MLLEAARRGAAAASLRPDFDRRGLRQRRRRREPRDRRAAAAQSVCGEQSWRGPAGLQLLGHLRRAGYHHARIEQLRTVSVSRKADSALRHQRSGRHPRAAVRRRHERSATGCTWTITAARSTCSSTKAANGEVYNIGGGNEVRNVDLTHGSSSCGQDRRRSSSRWPIGRVTTAATASIRRSCERSAGPRRSSFEAGLRETVDWYRRMSGGGGRSKRPTLHFAPTTKRSTEGLNCSSGFSNTGREPGTRNPERGTVLMQNPVLVTGAAGFAGSHLVEQLGNSCDVVAWARSHPPAEIAHLARWTKIDLLDRDRVRQEIRSIQPSAVYHCAGASHVGASWQNTAQPLANNALATHHLLDALRRARVDARVLVAGSATVYAPSVAPLREEDLLARTALTPRANSPRNNWRCARRPKVV